MVARPPLLTSRLLACCQAALDYLYFERDDIDKTKIFAFGRSLGGAVAIRLAADHQDRVQGHPRLFSAQD